MPNDEEEDQAIAGTIVKFEDKYYVSFLDEDNRPDTIDFDPSMGYLDIYQNYYPPNSVVVGQTIYLPLILIDKGITDAQIKDLQFIMKLTRFSDISILKRVYDTSIWEYRRKWQSSLWDFKTGEWLGPPEDEPSAEVPL